jgi:DNA polymerase-3 subunit epsilon
MLRFKPRRILDLLSGVGSGDRRQSAGRRPEHSELIGSVRYVVFDSELTGLAVKHDSIVSLGAIEMQGGRIELGRTFYRLVDPRTALRGSSVVVHGITPTEAREGSSIAAVLPEFLKFCGDSIVVGHVVSIDIAFLNSEMERSLHRRFPNAAVDTLRIHRWLKERVDDACAFYGGSAETADLFSLAKEQDISVAGAHNALNDAYVTAQLFQRFLSMLPRYGIRTVGDLVRIGKP